MKKTHKIILLILFGVFLSALFVLLGRKPGEPAPGVVLVPPKIPRYVSGQINVSFNLREEEFNFPEKLRLLSVAAGTITKGEASSLALKLGFEGPPQEFEDINEGVKYYWTTTDNFLVITPETGTIKYGPVKEALPVVVNGRLEDEALIKNAVSVLSELGILSGESLSGSSILSLKENEAVEGLSETTREEAELFQVNLTYSVSDYQIFTLNPSSPLVYVRILPNGDLFEFSLVLFKEVSLGLTELSLKNFEEVKASISELKLVSVLNGFLNLAELSAEDIESASVEKITLVYFHEAGGGFLQPVFVLEGPVEISGSEADRAIFYLPAISNYP